MTPANCQQCGAPLPVTFAPIVACHYCGRQYHNAQIHAPAPAAMPAPRPPTSSSAKPLIIVGVVFGVVMVASAVAAFFFASGSTSSVTPVSRGAARAAPPIPGMPSPGALVQWDSTEVFFFGGEGGVQNLVGVGSFGDGSQALVGLASATGDVLWRSPSGMCDLFTDDTRILRFETGKTLARYDVKTGKQTWSIQLSDNLGGLALGEKCAVVKLYMGQSPPFGIDTDTGKLAPCTTSAEPARRPQPWEVGDITVNRAGVTLTGEILSDSKPINPDPARLAITARRGSQKLWQAAPQSLEPVWESGGFDRSLAFTSTGAFLFGRAAADHAARFAFIDTATGRIAYEKPAAGKVETRVQVGATGALAFVIHDQRLEAYETTTGTLRWSIHR